MAVIAGGIKGAAQSFEIFHVLAPWALWERNARRVGTQGQGPSSCLSCSSPAVLHSLALISLQRENCHHHYILIVLLKAAWRAVYQTHRLLLIINLIVVVF